MQVDTPRAPRASADRKHPPSPPGWPLIGHLPHLAGDVLSFLTRCARDYGDVVSLKFGQWPALMVSDPELIGHVLLKKHHDFGRMRFFFRHVNAFFGNGLLSSDGDLWARQRRLAAPAFSGKQLESYGAVMVRYAERMLDDWQAGQIRNLHSDMMALTLKIAAKTLFDAEVEREVAEIDHALSDVTDEIAARYSRPFVIPDYVPLPGHVRYRRGLRRFEAVVAQIIQERQARPGGMTDVLSMLMAARDEHGAAMSDQQLRDEAVTMLFAGHETTALALSWTWYLLGQYPESETSVAQEVTAVLGSRPATVADLASLPVTESVVKEALRLYPPAWAVGREALRDCEIGEYPVAGGTTIVMYPWVVHRDERYFESPNEFRPERWLGDLARQLPRFAYFPFGGGPHICIGNRFAMMEAMLILVAVVQRFRLELQSARPATPFPSITLRPKGGVWVKVCERRGS